jgi:hypothetical protein
MTDWIRVTLRLRRSLAFSLVVALIAVGLGLGIWMRGFGGTNRCLKRQSRPRTAWASQKRIGAYKNIATAHEEG